VVPDRSAGPAYDEMYELYRELYPGSAAVVHALAARQQR